MKKLIFFLFLIAPTLSMSQKHIEIIHNTENKSIGINYIDVSNNFIIGAERGLYKYILAKVEYQKYKIGHSILFKEILGGQNNLLVSSTVCYNNYDVKYNFDKIKKMPLISCEIGVRSNFTERLYFGFQYDIILNHGGFSISFLIFK